MDLDDQVEERSRDSGGLFVALLERFAEIGGVEFELAPRETSSRACVNVTATWQDDVSA